MRGNNFKEKKVVPLIFTQFCIRSHLNQLERMTPQDVYYLATLEKYTDVLLSAGIYYSNGRSCKSFKVCSIVEFSSELKKTNLDCF